MIFLTTVKGSQWDEEVKNYMTSFMEDLIGNTAKPHYFGVLADGC